jgi:hypothetical protein
MAKMKRSIPIIAIVMVLFLVLPCYGEEKESKPVRKVNEEEILYPQFKEIEFFGILTVSLFGDGATQLGLNEQELTDFFKLKYKKNFATFPHKPAVNPFDFFKDENIFNKVGVIKIRVWTVHRDFSENDIIVPVAYHVRLASGYMASPQFDYNQEYLGWCLKENTNKTIKEVISQFVERFAITFFKARGEM